MKPIDKGKPLFFYGWVVTGAGLVIAIIGLGIRYSYGVFIKSLEAEFAVSRGSISIIFSVYMLLCSVLAILGGLALDRYGPRKLGFALGCLTCAALVVTSQCSSMWQVFLSYSVLLSLGTGPIYTLVNSTASRWFEKKRGLAVGITTAGGGAGAILIAPLATYLIFSYGWRYSLMILGIMAGVVIVAMAFLMKKDPADMGLSPDGLDPTDSGTVPRGKGKGRIGNDLSFRQAFKTSQFWLLGATWLFLSLSIHMVFVHVVPYAVDTGISPMEAAFILSLIGASNIPGRIVVGQVSDTIGRKLLAVSTTFAQFLSLVWLMWAGELWSLYVFGVAFGLLWGGASTMVTVIIGDIFGTRSIGTIMGVLSCCWAIGAAAGPAIGGFVFDASGSYFLAFGAGAAASLMATLAIAPVKRAE